MTGFASGAATATLLVLALSPPPLAAHTQNGSLGAAAAATDAYQVTCSDDGSGVPGSIVVQVTNLTAGSPPPVLALVHKGAAATTTTDPASADGAPSPLVFVNAGVGVYDVFVAKPAAGAASYTLTIHCMTGDNGSGEHTGTTIVFKQNQ